MQNQLLGSCKFYFIKDNLCYLLPYENIHKYFYMCKTKNIYIYQS